MSMVRSSTLSVDDLLRHEALGATALYRVAEVTEELVSVEVLAVPGLARGARLSITRCAAQGMPFDRTARQGA
jgi:hypothetical protein